MAFKIYSTDDNRVPGIEYLPASTITPKVGMALTMSNGNLAVASGSSTPMYISVIEKSSACKSGEIIPVIRVGKDIIFETSFSVDPSSLNVGDKVTIDSSGMNLTATKTSGVAEIVHMDEGAMCRVRF